VPAAVITFFTGWQYFVVKLSGRPWWNPLWTAFTLTAVALLYGPDGIMGYAVPMDNPFIDHPPVWVGHILWPQVQMASALALGSAFSWWQGLRRF
jgi:hypothetical protein